MKRFLDNKIVTAQEKSGLGQFWDDARSPFTPVNPKTEEAKIQNNITKLTDDQRVQLEEQAVTNLGKVIENRKAALSIYVSNGVSEQDYEAELDDVASDYSVPDFQWNQYIIGFWPLMKNKNFSFSKFRELLFQICNRVKSPAQVNDLFTSLVEVLPNLAKTMGTSDEVITKALDFLSKPGKSADDFQKYLLYQMVLRYGLYKEIPEDKRADAITATEKLQQLKSNVTVEENEYLNFLTNKSIFLSEQHLVIKGVTRALMAMQTENYKDLVALYRSGIDWGSLSIWLKLFKEGLKFGTLEQGPFSTNSPAAATTGEPVGTQTRVNFISDKVKRKIFAQEDQSAKTKNDILKGMGMSTQSTQEPKQKNLKSTDSSAFQELYGENYKAILFFETIAREKLDFINKNIAYIIDKSASSTPIGPFSANSVFQYLENEEESLKESDRVILLIEDTISQVNDSKITLLDTLDTENSDEQQQQNAIDAINERFSIFIKEVRSKQLGLKFNKILISKANEYTEAQEAYEKIKIEMENNVSARPIIAPKALVAGFDIAKILEEISKEFALIAASSPLRSEQATKTAERYKIFAMQQRAYVLKEILPNLAATIGLDATKPSFSPSFGLNRESFNIFKNLRLAGKFMDKEVESDKRFRDYWNNLFMQSKDPRPMGDIIEEKPKHGNLTTEEDAKLHKDTMRRFKKPVQKKHRFKKK